MTRRLGLTDPSVFFALKSLCPKISHQKASYLVELVDFSQDAVFLAPIGALVHIST